MESTAHTRGKNECFKVNDAKKKFGPILTDNTNSWGVEKSLAFVESI